MGGCEYTPEAAHRQSYFLATTRRIARMGQPVHHPHCVKGKKKALKSGFQRLRCVIHEIDDTCVTERHGASSAHIINTFAAFCFALSPLLT